ncbi:MAG: HEAT repeat domain-containing protein [Chloroflexi bacterium]|nr:HEAT repeat domain-containing protein [Chloroflexota bacterium]
MSIADFFDTLTNESEGTKHSTLPHLSGLSADELEQFARKWVNVPEESRRDLVSKLLVLGEENVELEFSGVFRICLTDSNPDVREQAIRGLWEFEERTLIRPLTKILTTDSHPHVRIAAALGLRRFGMLAQRGKLILRDSKRVYDSLLTAINRNDEDMAVKRRAIEAIACFENDEVATLIHEAYEGVQEDLKQSALFAMGQTSNPRWLPTVLKEMENDDPAIRYEAVTAAGRLGDDSIIPRIVNLIEDEDVLVQTASIAALGNIGGAAAKHSLLQCLKSNDEVLAQAIQLALAQLEFVDDPLGLNINT